MQSETILALAKFASSCTVDAAPEPVRRGVGKAFIDSLGVALAGQNTDEYRNFSGAWPSAAGSSSVWGQPQRIDTASATMLNAVALCMLELDEGNKFARGHPAAHVLPVALAEAERIGASGRSLLDAFLTGYEVAARVGRAFRPVDGLHPHGNWGAIGAAAAIGRLNGFSVRELAEAMDAAAGLMLASPFASALQGTFVRNTWLGSAGVNALTSARIAQSGLGTIDGTGTATLGGILGTIKADEIVQDVGERWEITGGYFKRHSSCNYTHPPADAALEARRDDRFDPEVVERITVYTHALAIPLSSTAPQTRLAAMFSIPHVVAVALTHGRCHPEAFAVDALHDPAVSHLRERTSVEFDEAIDTHRPARRGARVEIALSSGQLIVAEVPDAVGDAGHHPLSPAEINDKLRGLIGDERLDAVHETVRALQADAPVDAAMKHLSNTNEINE